MKDFVQFSVFIIAIAAVLSTIVIAMMRSFKNAGQPPTPNAIINPTPNGQTLTDIEIPFGRMVAILFKISFAGAIVSLFWTVIVFLFLRLISL